MTMTTVRLLPALFAATIATAGGAQTFPAPDPVLQRIWTLGMDSSNVYRLAQALTDSVGPRLTGSPGHRAGNEWALAQYRGWNIPARNEQYGTWRGWRRGVSHLDLVRPRVRSLEAMMLAWSPGTGGKDVEARAVVLPSFADSAAFVKWLPSVRGAFVLISMPQPTCRADANWKEFATPESFETMQRERTAATGAWNRRIASTGFSARDLPRRLEQAGAAGVITSLWSAGWGVTKIFQARTERVPTYDVSCEDYGLIFRLAERGQGAVLRARADAAFLGENPVFNTMAEIRGSEKPDEYVMLSAHFDSWDGASGATDNGTGTVTMMEAMRILSIVYPRPKRTILVGHWGGEEQGLNGSRAFAADNPKVVQGLQSLFNQDNGTGRVSTISMQGLVNAGGHWGRWASRLPMELSRQISFIFPGAPAGGGSDYAGFICAGAPAFNLSSTSFDYGTYTWHTNRDTFDKIVFDDLKSNAVLTAMLVYLASEDPERVPRERRVLAAGSPSSTAVSSAPTPAPPVVNWPACQQPARSSGQSTR